MEEITTYTQLVLTPIIRCLYCNQKYLPEDLASRTYGACVGCNRPFDNSHKMRQVAETIIAHLKRLSPAKKTP